MLLRFVCALVLIASAFGQEVVPGRFIVELDTPPAIGQRDLTLRRSRIRDEHRALERSIQARGLRIRASVDTVANALIVDAPDAASLSGLPGVRRVQAVRLYHLFLNKALPIHEVEAAWDLAGGMDKAGEGMKIAIIDTGIDSSHPGFQAPEGMSAPEGFPQASSDGNLLLTNGKIIVARSFDSLDAMDRYGHGTGVAMAAAGVRHESPRGFISGVAPRAWLGVYRASYPNQGAFPEDYLLQALDWAVKDGMDVINMSLGLPGAFGPDEDSVFTNGVRRALENGIIVVNAAGNDGGPMTVDDTASADQVIAVGSNRSTAAGQTMVVPSQGLPIPAAASSNVVSLDPIMGPMIDTESLGNALGCDPFPAGVFEGRIPLILRGTCNFTVKLENAAAAGAVAAIVYNSANPSSGSPDDLVTMSVDDNPTIPALFVGNTNGRRLKDLIQNVEDFQVQLRFQNPDAKPNAISSFSSRGPSVNLRIKPDLVATGETIYTATAIGPPTTICQMCDPSGYMSVNGTSFSAPLVAGAAAVLKSARRDLTLDDYRSLLINSANAFILADGSAAPVQTAGAGMLNVKSAMQSTITAAPVSVSFAAGGGTIDLTKEVTLKNLGADPASLALSIDSTDTARPQLSAETITIDPSSTAAFNLAFSSGGLTPGTYQGFVRIQNTSTGSESRIPYWYAVQGSTPAGYVVLDARPSSPRAGNTVRVWLRVYDQAGLPVTDPQPAATPVSGGGAVVSIDNGSRDYPNTWLLTIRTGSRPGPNVFQIQIGNEVFTLQITTS